MKKSAFQIKKIGEKTYSLKEPLSNCLLYLLVGSESSLLVDTGMGTADLRDAVNELTDKRVNVVNTHGHLDHIANNHQFENIYLCKDDINVFCKHTNPAYVQELAKKTIPALIRPFLKKKMDNMLHPKPGGVYHYIEDGYAFDLGNRIVEVVATPGHTPGSMCLLDKAQGALYTGDTICDWGILLNLDHCLSPEEYLKSMEVLRKYKPLVASLHPGHRLNMIGTEYIDKYYECAKGIVHGSIPAKKVHKRAESYLETHYNDIRIQHKEARFYSENTYQVMADSKKERKDVLD